MQRRFREGGEGVMEVMITILLSSESYFKFILLIYFSNEKNDSTRKLSTVQLYK